MISLAAVGRWFLRSGIQESSGGVARYYRIDTGRNLPVSTEITGYTCSALLFLAERTGEPDYREAALRAGRFLTRQAWDAAAGAFPFEIPAGGETPAYFFDCGIIVRGLLALARATGEAEFEETARACAASMCRDFQNGRCPHPAITLPGKQPLPYEPRWSRQPGCYQLKAALGALETGNTERYEAILEFALADHAGFLPGAPEPARVMDRLHAYCYFLEGLLPAACRPECARALADGIRRAGGLLRDIRPLFERSDVNAQLLRVRLYADRLGAVPLDSDAAAEEAAALRRFQISSDDPRTDGAVAFGARGEALLPFANPVSTAFCLQASELWRDYRTGRLDPDWRTLI
jgi:hypothetical protein